MKKIYVILYLILICAFLLTSCAAEQDQKSQYLPPATAKSEVITDTSESITENDADIQTKEIYSETGAEYTKYIANKTSKIFQNAPKPVHKTVRLKKVDKIKTL